MRKLILISAVLLLVALPFKVTMSQENVVGGHFGVVMGQGHHPSIAWGVVTDISTNTIPVARTIISRVEASILLADREWQDQAELNVGRLFTIRQFPIGSNFYLGLGGGIWHYFNTDGQDTDYFAFRAEGGVMFVDLIGANPEFTLAGEIVRMPGPDTYYIFAQLSVF